MRAPAEVRLRARDTSTQPFGKSIHNGCRGANHPRASGGSRAVGAWGVPGGHRAPPEQHSPNGCRGARQCGLVARERRWGRRALTAIDTEIEARAAGFDPVRLARIDRHFRRFVDDGRLPGWLVLVSRHGRVVHASTYGWRDLEARLPVEMDTLFRIYSMTKPVTSVAAMMLYEEGAFELSDPVARFVPAFADMRVYLRGPAAKPLTLPAKEPVRMRHLLTHTAGLTYGFHHVHVVDLLYRKGSRRMLRALGFAAAAVRAGRGMELLGCHRRARAGRRGGVRSAA